MWINCRKCGQLMDDCFTIPDYVCFDCWDEAEANRELYYCSDCGQVSVLPLKDNKCEECSSRSASSGNKKKPKIQKAAALIMAMMIALSCLTFSAFAEDIPTDIVSVVDGKYKGYDCISFSQNQVISSDHLKALYDGYKAADSSINLMYVYLLGFDSSGVPHFYSPFGYDCQLLSFQYDSNGDFRTSLYFDTVENANGDSYDYVYYGYNASSAYIHYKLNTKTVPEIYSYNFSFTDGSSGFDGLCSEQMYLVFVPFNTSATDYRTILPSLLAGDYSTDYAPSAPKIDYSAKFHSFASMNDGDVILNMLDWIGAGKQYPIADFSINDNGQYHDYSLRISLNKNYVDVCMGLWEDYRNNLISSALPGGLGCLITGIKSGSTTDIVNGAIQLKFFGRFPLSVFTVPAESGTAAAVRKLSQYNMLKSLDNLSYVTQYNLTDSHLNFAEGESSVRAYSVCLADYVTIVKGLLYRLDIVDNNTGMILDTAYFCNDSTYAKTNTGYGTKVYNYDSADDLNNDLENDNGYISNSGKVETDKMQTDNNTDIVVNFDPNELDLGSYMDSLNGIVSDVSSFFTWVWQLFPPEIMTIIIIGVGLLVTCGLVKFFVG